MLSEVQLGLAGKHFACPDELFQHRDTPMFAFESDIS